MVWFQIPSAGQNNGVKFGVTDGNNSEVLVVNTRVCKWSIDWDGSSFVDKATDFESSVVNASSIVELGEGIVMDEIRLISVDMEL